MLGRDRRTLVWGLLAAWVIVGWSYRATYESIFEIWRTNSTFSHGFLIVPICLWLAWRKRAELTATDWYPSWLGVALVLASTATWIVGRGVGVIGLEQFAAVAMIPSFFLAILGWQATLALVFPLAFMFLAVPVGHALVPGLMGATADVAAWTLNVSGVPIYRSNMFISIPSGNFEVARACSGLNYLVTGFVLGVLYAYLNYAGWRKRLLAVLAFIVVPIVANGLRVYVTILVSHLTEMRFGPGAEHVWFGRVFFILVMLAMFWLGRRWRDDDAPRPMAVSSAPARPMTPAAWATVPVAVLAALIGPPYLASSVATARARLADVTRIVTLPAGAAGWTGPLQDSEQWRPAYRGASAERVGSYLDPAGSRVDVYVGVYGLGVTAGAEMISYGNRIFADQATSLAVEARRAVPLGQGGSLLVRELQVRDAIPARQVWYWFMVGDRNATSPFVVKGLEAAAFVTGDIKPEKIITLSTTLDAGAEARLQAFAGAHASCIASGLDARVCRQ